MDQKSLSIVSLFRTYGTEMEQENKREYAVGTRLNEEIGTTMDYVLFFCHKSPKPRFWKNCKKFIKDKMVLKLVYTHYP